jgi:outer membrane receptor protein involved in Fe transport
MRLWKNLLTENQPNRILDNDDLPLCPKWIHLKPMFQNAAALVLRRSFLVLLLLCAPGFAKGATEARRSFHLPQGDAAENLRRFASQAGREIMFPADAVAGVTTRAVQGSFAPREALERMLAGTDLTFIEDAQTRAVLISRRVPAASHLEASSPSQTSAPSPPMKKTLLTALTSWMAFALPSPSPAQATAPAPASADIRNRSDGAGETVQLTAFQVTADADNSYGALQSNSLTSFRLDLVKTPVTAQVFTQSFMDDVAATNIEEMLVKYHGSVSGATHNSTDAVTQEPGDRSGGSGLSIRGINTAEISRDGFNGPPPAVRSSTGVTTNYQVERVEVIEGPQSILYGASSGGGVVNTISKRANFNQKKGFLRAVVDSNSSLQGLLDYNFGTQKIAVRVAALAAEHRTVRDKVGDDMTGLYAQFAVQVHPTTVVRLQTEKTDALARVSFKPNLNAFMSATDPRRNLDARYLALTTPLDDLGVIDSHLDYYNIDSLGSWWSSERITTEFSALTIETRLPAGFSMQLRGMYNETLNLRATDGRTLLPAAGRPNAAANPYNVTAMRIGSPVQVNEQRDRTKGVRLAFLHEGNLSIGSAKARSQTAFGGHATERGPRFASSGIAKAYYRADDNWNPIVSPTVTLDYGRLRLENAYFPVQGGVPKEPLFQPGSERVVVDGQKYVLQPRILQEASRVSPTNPAGLIPNNPTAANPNQYSGNWHRGADTESYTLYGANFSDWMDGRLSTLVGYSLTQFEAVSVQPGQNVGVTPKTTTPAWQAGANYAIRPWLRAYVGMGASEQPENATLSLFGETLRHQTSEGLTPDFGLKVFSRDGRFAAQLNYNPTTKAYNERRNTGDVNALDIVNPDGVNGRFGAGAQNRVNVDRSLESASLTVTADPTRNWRMRMSVTHLDGEILSSVREAVRYNDQFFTSGNTVTYRDGTPVLIDPTGGNNRTTPLTLPMINDPSHRFYANPDRSSGAITNTNLRNALTAVDPVRGTAATGTPGLPLSAVQYNFQSPYPDGIYTIYEKGDKNTGFNEYSFNFQNNYTFASGILKGLSLFGDVRTYARNRAYYVFDPATRTRSLFELPRATVFNAGVTYRYKITERFTWTTQLNIQNLFNHYKVWIMPDAPNRQTLLARLSTQPRQFIWSNTISF